MDTRTRGQEIADNIRAEMARQRRTGKQLAALLGCSTAAASRRTTGETEVTASEALTIAAWLNLPISQLLDPQTALAQPDYGATTRRLFRRSTDRLLGLHIAPTPAFA